MPMENIIPNIFAVANFIVTLVFGLGIIAVIGFAVFRVGIFKRYPVTVIIFEKRGDLVVPFKDAGRRITEKTGEIWYELKKKKLKIKAVDYKHILGGNIMLLFSPTSSEFHPIDFDEKKESIKPVVDSSIATLHALRLEKNVNKYLKQSFWVKYGNMIVMVIGIFIMGISIVLVLKQIGDINSGFHAVAGAMQNVANNLGKIVVQTSSTAPAIH